MAIQAKLDSNKGEINWELIARKIELETIINHQDCGLNVAPIQFDHTNNVIQHIGSITGNEVAMRATGVIEPIEGEEFIDFYTLVGEVIIQHLKGDIVLELKKEIPTEVIKTLVETFESSNKLRPVIKKAVITKAYAVTPFSMMKYINEAILKDGIKLSFNHSVALTALVNSALSFILPAEIQLIKDLQNSVSNIGSKVR